MHNPMLVAAHVIGGRVSKVTWILVVVVNPLSQIVRSAGSRFLSVQVVDRNDESRSSGGSTHQIAFRTWDRDAWTYIVLDPIAKHRWPCAPEWNCTFDSACSCVCIIRGVNRNPIAQHVSRAVLLAGPLLGIYHWTCDGEHSGSCFSKRSVPIALSVALSVNQDTRI